MDHIDLKYVNLLSVKLQRFKIKSNNPYKVNFRCIVCGDSEKSKTKARAWIYEYHNKPIYHCFNCGVSISFANILKDIDLQLYNDYIVERKIDFVGKTNQEKPKLKPLEKLVSKRPSFTLSSSPLHSIHKVSSLQSNHPVKKYVNSRMIPSNKHYMLYYAPKFVSWIHNIIPDKLGDMKDHPRLIIPLIGEDQNVFGVSARAFDKKLIRYITIMFDESQSKVFGLNTVDFSKKYYILEGPIDSLFIDNSIAMVGADFSFDCLKNKENAVFIFDNERRNAQIVKRMERYISKGLNVCFWPENIKQKDVNDMILAGIKTVDIQDIINNNTFSGHYKQ